MVKYNLKIRISNDEFQEFNNINSKQCIETVNKIMKESHDIDYKMKNNNLFNIVNHHKRPVHPFVHHFFKIEYAKKN